MPWWVRDRGTTSTGKASGSGSQKAPDPPPLHFRGIYGREANAIQGKAAFFAGERTAVPGGIIVRDGDKQPGQHGCGHYRLQRGSNYAAGHQALLKRAGPFYRHSRILCYGANRPLADCGCATTRTKAPIPAFRLRKAMLAWRLGSIVLRGHI
jgi:hypothetical protein